MPITIGQRKVLESGSVLSERRQPVVFEIAGLKVTCILVQETGTFGARATVHGTDHVQVELVNFDNPAGTAWDAEIGRLGGKPLIFAVYVHALGVDRRPVHLLNYTFSVGEGHVDD